MHWKLVKKGEVFGKRRSKKKFKNLSQNLAVLQPSGLDSDCVL